MTGPASTGPASTGPAATGCQRAREEAAVALLERRPPDGGTRQHLAGCPECAREAARLAGLPGLLDLVRDPALRPADEDPPAELLDRLLGRARQRRRTRRVLLAAAAAVLLPAAGFAVHELREPPSTGRVTASTAGPVLVRSASDPATGAWMTVELRPAAASSELTVSVGGLPADLQCRLLALDRSGGSREVAGTWTATAADSWTVRSTVPVPRADLTVVQVVDERTGRVLLPVRLA